MKYDHKFKNNISNKYKKNNTVEMFNRKVLEEEILKNDSSLYLKTPHALLFMPYLPDSASKIFNYIYFAVLLYDKANFSATISLEEFSVMTGISESTVKRQLKVLQTFKMINIRRQKKNFINGGWKTPIPEFSIPLDIVDIVKKHNYIYLQRLEADGSRGNLRIYQIGQFYKRFAPKIFSNFLKENYVKSNTFITDVDKKLQWEKYVLLDQENLQTDAYTEGVASREELLCYLDSCGLDLKEAFLDYEKALEKLKPHQIEAEFIPYERVAVYAAAAIGDLLYYGSPDKCPNIEDPSRFFKVQFALKKFHKDKHSFSKSMAEPLGLLRMLAKNQSNIDQIQEGEEFDIWQVVLQDMLNDDTKKALSNAIQEILDSECKKIDGLKLNFDNYIKELTENLKKQENIHQDFMKAKSEKGRQLFLKDFINSESSDIDDNYFTSTVEELIQYSQADRQREMEKLISLLPRDKSVQEAEEIIPIEPPNTWESIRAEVFGS